jgi:hypothetical protein
MMAVQSMNVNFRVNEKRGIRRRSDAIYVATALASVLLYASLFIAAFEQHKILAICVTFCLGVSLRSMLREHDLRTKERVLAVAKEELAK